MALRSQSRFRPQVNALECRTNPSIVPNNALVVGASAGEDPFVTVIDPNTNKDIFRFMPFEQSFRGGVSVAVGDLVGDSTPDIAVAAASGGGPRVAIYDGATGKVAKDFFVYEPSFTGGVTVAIGDVNGDGTNDLITGTGTGGAPRVTAIDVATGNTLLNFFAFEDSFRGGVNVSSNDVNGDGIDDVVVGTGVGGAPRVTAFSGDDTGNVLLNFFAYDSKFRDGVNVNSADMDGDGKADILIGSGTGGAPHVRVISGADGAELQSFFAFDSNLRGGARVAAVDTNGDDKADTLVVGTPGHLRRFFREVNGSTISDDINIVNVSGGGFMSGNFGESHGKGHGNGHGKGHHGNGGDDDQGDDDNGGNTIGQVREVAGVIEAVNADLGTVTIRTGANGTLAIYPIADTTTLKLDGETATDLNAFAKDDIALIRIGSNGKVSSLTAVSPDNTGTTVDAPAGRTIDGAVVTTDETAGTVTVLTQNGTLYLIPTGDATKFERNNKESGITLADILAGDHVEAKIGSDGTATKIEAVGPPAAA